MKLCEKSPAKDKNLPLEPIVATRQISIPPVMHTAFPIGDLYFLLEHSAYEVLERFHVAGMAAQAGGAAAARSEVRAGDVAAAVGADALRRAWRPATTRPPRRAARRERDLRQQFGRGVGQHDERRPGSRTGGAYPSPIGDPGAHLSPPR